MKRTTRTLEVLEVPLGAGRPVLRVGLYRDPQGEPEELVLASGWPERGRWTESLADGLTLPPEALSGLLEALSELEETT